jgi:hypothetical protein
MAAGATGRRGRRLVFNPEGLPAGTSKEVKQLDAALIELINKAGTTLTQIAEESKINSDRKSLSRQLHQQAGPDEHVVMAIVEHCAQILEDDRSQLIEHFSRLWSQAQDNGGDSPDNHQLPPGLALTEPADPSLAIPYLEMLTDGQETTAATMLAGQYPQGGPTVGGILAEIGRRIPSGTAGLLQAVAEVVPELATAYLQALTEADEDTAAEVRWFMPPPPEPEPPEDEGILGMDPASINGRRRAAMIRRGDTARVAAEILREAEFRPPPAVKETPKDDHARFMDLVEKAARGDEQERYDLAQATDLVMAVGYHAGDDASQLLGKLLNALTQDGHARLAAGCLAVLAKASTEAVREILDVINRPGLTAALKLLESGARPAGTRADVAVLLQQAPPAVLGDRLLERKQEQEAPVDFLQVRSPRQTLAYMTTQDRDRAARYLSRLISPRSTDPASASRIQVQNIIAAVVLDLSRADRETAGLLLYGLITVNPAAARRLLYLMAVPAAQGEPQQAADLLAAVLDTAPTSAPKLLAELAHSDSDPVLAPGPAAQPRPAPGEPGSVAWLLDLMATAHPDQGPPVATALLNEDIQHFKTQLQPLIRHRALALAGELLCQLPQWEPVGPWPVMSAALEEGNLDTALTALEQYLRCVKVLGQSPGC